jgi:outer membrane protein TolC
MLPLLQGRATDANRIGLRLGELGLEEKRADLDAKLLQTRAKVAEAYWKWVAAGLKYKIADQQLGLAEARDQQLARQVRSGALPAVDLLENRRAIMARRQELVSAQRKLEAAALKLSLYLRDDQGRPLVPAPSRVPDSIPIPPDLSQEEAAAALQSALENRPEVARESALLQQAEVELELADNNLAPTLDIEVETSKDLGSEPTGLKKSLSPWIFEAGLVFKLPLQRRKVRGKQQSATAKRQQQLLELEFLRDTIANEVADALSGTRAAQQKVRITAQGATVSYEVARAERRRLELGSTDLIKLNLVEQYAYTAQSKYIEAQADLRIARAKLRAVSAQP